MIMLRLWLYMRLALIGARLHAWAARRMVEQVIPPARARAPLPEIQRVVVPLPTTWDN